MFRAQYAYHQEVNDANCTYAASGIVTLCKWPSAGFVVPDGRFVFVQFYFNLLVLEYLFCFFSNANIDIWLAVHHSITFLFFNYYQLDTQISCSFTQRSLAESDDNRGCICTICVVDLLMMSGFRSKHVEEFNLMLFVWMNKKFVCQVGNNKKVILWCTANQITKRYLAQENLI
jgi:hypothetical protein